MLYTSPPVMRPHKEAKTSCKATYQPIAKEPESRFTTV